MVDENRTPPVRIEFREPYQLGLSADVLAVKINCLSELDFNLKSMIMTYDYMLGVVVRARELL